MPKYKVAIKEQFGVFAYEAENEKDFVDGLKTIPALLETTTSILRKSDLTKEVTEELPNIQKPKNLSDAVIKLLSSKPWGNIPRTLHEIHSALAHNAIHVSIENLGSLMTKMKKQDRVRRIKKDNVYAYTLPL